LYLFAAGISILDEP